MVKCLVCEEREGNVLADSDSLAYRNGMPVCLECFLTWGMEAHDDSPDLSEAIREYMKERG